MREALNDEHQVDQGETSGQLESRSLAERKKLYEAWTELDMINDQLIQMEEHFIARTSVLGSDMKGESAEDILQLQQYVGALQYIVKEIESVAANMAAEPARQENARPLPRQDD